ncbi:hypothetical protein BJX63DRAFT_438266 [Aspergillus granulosus]|uniref:F-box domain-containing protein n=1 Tax=Aspergillus granulosus TaxID=176169 RepID=A0ABR4GSF8_9EURO
MEGLPIEILRTICILLRDDDSNDLCSFRRANHFHCRVATPVLFERLTVRLQSNQDFIAELSAAGLGRHYLKHARSLSVVAVRNLLDKHHLEYTTRLKELELNLFDHIPRAARDSFIDSSLVTGVTPIMDCLGWKWIFHMYSPEDWQPLISMVSRLEHLTEFNYGLINLFPEPLLQAMAAHHPDCVLNIWNGSWTQRSSAAAMDRLLVASNARHPAALLSQFTWTGSSAAGVDPTLVASKPAPYPPSRLPGYPWGGNLPQTSSNTAVDRTFITSNPTRHPPSTLSQYSLDYLRSFSAMCPVGSRWNTTNTQQTWLELTEHLPFLAACPNLKHLIIQQYGKYDEIAVAQPKWRALVSSAKPTPKARLQSLTIVGQGLRGTMLSKVSDIFDLSSLRSLDIKMSHDSSILQQVAPRLSQLTRLFISLDLDRDEDANPNPQANSPSLITAILAFHPLEYLCLRGARSPSSLHTILAHHGPSLSGLLIEVSDHARSMDDIGLKFPTCSPDDIARIGASCPRLRELRLPIQRTQGDPAECAKYAALGTHFPNLRSLLTDLHCDTRTWPIDRDWRPAASDLREILVNAATDSALVRGIWDLVSSTQGSNRLQRLACIPFGGESLQLPEAHLVLSIGHSFLVQRGEASSSSSHAPESPVKVRRVGERALDLQIGGLLMERKIGKGLSRRLRLVFDELWPGDAPWETRWRSFPLRRE